MDRKVGAAAAATSQLQTPHYDDFEPLCYWRREDGQDTLVVHLPEFKKEQLKIQISSTGILKITGERPVDATSKRSRFLKEIKVTKDYNANNIHAKFAQGRLHVTFPKKISSSPSQKPSSAKEFPANQTQKQEIIGRNDQVPDHQQNAANTTGKLVNGDIRGNRKYEEASLMNRVKEERGRENGQLVAPTGGGGGGEVVRSKRLGKVAVISVGVAMVAALGAYVMYKYWALYDNADENL